MINGLLLCTHLRHRFAHDEPNKFRLWLMDYSQRQYDYMIANRYNPPRRMPLDEIEELIEIMERILSE